jgi:two-component system, chemotaxis family, CheB/CheR fusion protein
VSAEPRATARRSPRRASATQDFPIVGIGASAGGLDACRRFLQKLGPRPGVAVVLVQHLDPTHESILPDLLARVAEIGVTQAVDGVTLEPNHVYVIPPADDLRIVDGHLKLSPRSAPHMPIDLFLRTLASVRGDQAIGVVFSGAGSDGTLGVRAIKEAGGFTLAQSPDTCKYPSMPRSAIATGCVDLVLPPEAIAREVTRLAGHPYLKTGAASDAEPDGDEADALRRLFETVQKATGADVGHYKQTTVRRRLARRMAMLRVGSFDAYASRLTSDPEEASAFYQDLLISVTSFFREPESFETLGRSMAAALRKAPSDRPVRVWIPGCATGEEAYSIAITLVEALGPRALQPPLQLFATDASDRAIDRARSGLYPEGIADEVSPARLKRFFVPVPGGGFQVVKSIREMCVFARHDLSRDPPFTRMDLISCRNVLIYLEPALQKRILGLFHLALAPGGLLALGMSESVAAGADLFVVQDKKHRIFARNAGAAARGLSGWVASPAAPASGPAAPPPRLDVERHVDRLLLERFAPPAILVDAQMNIHFFRGDTHRYLQHGHGRASLNVATMARAGLARPLREAITNARVKGVKTRKEGIRVRHRGRLLTVDVEVIPIPGGTPRVVPAAGRRRTLRPVDAGAERRMLVLFGEPPPPAKAVRTGRGPSGDRSIRARERDIAELTRELADARAYVEALGQEHEGAIEGLQAANEEVRSSNEELQSINEEMESAREELQATNEELDTVNEELRDRNTQLGQLNDDLVNLLGSIDVPIVVVGADRRLRRFTPAAQQMLNLIPGDIGRPLGDLQPTLAGTDLARLAGEAMETGTLVEREVRDRDGRAQLMRVRPYRAGDGGVDGAVIALTDVTGMRRAADRVQSRLDEVTEIVDTLREPILVLDGERRVHQANRSFYRMFALSREETLGRPLRELGGGVWDIPELGALLDALRSESRAEGFEVSREFGGLGDRTLLINAACLDAAASGPARILLAIEDVTESREADAERNRVLALEQAARRKAEDADALREQFLATVTHDLRGPVNIMTGWLHTLRIADGDEGMKERALDTLERALHSQARLIDDLLDSARIQSGKLRLSRHRTSLAAVARGALEGVRGLAAKKELRLELTVEGDERETAVLGDPDRLQQVAWNLISNAVKFTPEGGRVDVTVSAEMDAVQMRVRDTGRGIALEFLPHVFERFRQEREGAGKDRGLGLGLFIVREIVELHGGKVEVSSGGVGQGATFTVLFPHLPPETARVASAAAPRKERRKAGRRALEGVLVLLVDDDLDAREPPPSRSSSRGRGSRWPARSTRPSPSSRRRRPTSWSRTSGCPGETAMR